MNNKNIEKVLSILDHNGLTVYDDINAELEFDSLQFVSIMVDLEDCFLVTIPDNKLDGTKYHNALDFITTISSLLPY